MLHLRADHFTGRPAAMVTALRELAVGQLGLFLEPSAPWTAESILDSVNTRGIAKRENVIPDGWWPFTLLRKHGFGCLVGCVTVDAVGDIHEDIQGLSLRYTRGAEVGPHLALQEVVSGGRDKLAALVFELQEHLGRSGNWHWGDHFDVRSLSEALNVGILLFTNTAQKRRDDSVGFLYNIGCVREDFPYWIAIWWDGIRHYRLARVDVGDGQPRSFWATTELPAALLSEYRRFNRLAD
jgi:hypothetical protein